MHDPSGMSSPFARVSASQRRYLPPAVAVSTVAFSLTPPTGAHVIGADGRSGVLWVPLVRRTRPPFADRWALPGGPIPWDQGLGETALKTLRSAVHSDPNYLEQLYSFGAVERSAEAQRLVTIAYWALYSTDGLDTDHSAIDENVGWFPADRLPPLAFDHADIVEYAVERLRVKTSYSTVARRFLGDEFTLSQLRGVYEAILGEAVDPSNFRRQVLAQGDLIPTDQVRSGGRHRPARLYRFREDSSHAGERLTTPTSTKDLP